MVCTVGAIGKHWQEAQKGRSARPQRVKTGGGTHRTSWGRSPIQWILANGRTPPALPPSENLNRYVEDLNDARTPLAACFSILLETEDIEDNNAHEDAVVGKRSERMAFHKREKGRDHNPGDDERHEHPDPECEIIVLLEDVS